ncbi:CoA ester lyase [Schaalia sp. ZJ405]|uniref:HpcH/HpaI aldolase/citrate lyase family protein n=1 Tax=Schaalia sp. ZJ405 TaxID=2709403 RepID=UPI0013ED4A5F|nr:CoA ester lyase [Schaalia sp. ZJ405]QPK80924.1 CoA ester lyase [Schaalia sp. ZJ405]
MNENQIPLTWLYVPASRPDRMQKALDSPADVVIVDLEDAVAPAFKSEARRNLELLEEVEDRAVEVRINANGTPWHDADVQAVSALPRNVGVRLPKAESPQSIRYLSEQVDSLSGGPRDLTLLLESAVGVERAFELATSSPSIVAIGLGESDLRSDTGIRSEQAMNWVRSRVVIAARAAQLRPVAMSVFPNISNIDGLMSSCRCGAELGMLGRAAIHPRQLEPIRQVFTPSDDEVERAREVLERLEGANHVGEGVAVLSDGSFIDAAMIDSARRILAIIS